METSDFVYMCHPTHLHSSENMYQPIFRGLSISSGVYLSKAVVWVTPFHKKKDKLVLSRNDYNHSLFANSSVSEYGVMEITSPIGEAINATDWTGIINSPAYKLDIVNIRPYICTDFTNGAYSRNIHIKVFDRYDRPSNTITKKLIIKTAALVYTNVYPVTATNSQTYNKYTVDPNPTPEIFHKFLNFSYQSGGEL
jgi:hypothetical protein